MIRNTRRRGRCPEGTCSMRYRNDLDCYQCRKCRSLGNSPKTAESRLDVFSGNAKGVPPVRGAK